MSLKTSIIIVALAAVAVLGIGYYNDFEMPAYQPVSEDSPDNPSVLPPSGVIPPPQVNLSTISVVKLATDKSAYAGKDVSVNGQIQIAPLYSTISCPEDEPDCSPILGINLYLVEEGKVRTETNSIQIYKDGKPYPCSKQGEKYICGNFVDKQVVTLTGVLVKTQVPDLVVGSSGGEPPKTITWKDFYYFDVGSNTQVKTSGVKVLSPNGGEQLPYGSTQTIRWFAPSSISNVSISLLTWYPSCDPATLPPGHVCAGFATPPPEVYTIISSTPNDGSFSWNIPASYNAFDFDSSMGNYVIKVEAGQNSDVSDASFSIVAAP